jgi:hypothetical protein
MPTSWFQWVHVKQRSKFFFCWPALLLKSALGHSATLAGEALMSDKESEADIEPRRFISRLAGPSMSVPNSASPTARASSRLTDVKWCQPKLMVGVKHLAGSKTLRQCNGKSLGAIEWLSAH